MAGNVQELGRDIEELTKTPASDALFFGELERRVLELWDQEQEARLEINLLRAQRDGEFICLSMTSKNGNKTDKCYVARVDDLSSLSDEEIQVQLQQAERDLLTARSKHTITQNITNQVLITDPILKSIHSHSTITPLEKRLLPLLNERDTLSMVHAHLSSLLQTTYLSIAKLEQENIDAISANKALADRMLELARDVGTEKVEEVRDARVRAELEGLEGQVRKARREWRVWKSVVAGVVAGSGVDWAGDPELLEVVMDEEDEML